jgi:hypothetical protein
MGRTRREQRFEQDAILHAYDHPAPGQGGALSAVAASGTLTCDTKANSTDLDFYVLNDGQSKALLWYNVSGTQAAKYSKVGSKAVTTVTFPTKANVTNEDYFTIWDGHRFWKIMLDTDASGDSTGTADLVVDISGDTTAADVAAGVHAIIQETTSIPAFTEAIHLTSVDNADGTLTITCDVIGYDGNGVNTENFTHASGLITAAAGGTNPYPAEEFAELDISGETTAADVGVVIDAAINALTEVKITSTDNLDGTLSLANDEKGLHGNTAQVISETGSTLMALTDMTGGANADESGATLAVKLFTAQRKFKVDKVEYINPTGLAAHAANFWDIGIKADATSMAEWSTDSAAEGALGADTVNECTLSATVANRVAAKDAVISFYATKNASAANLPAGRIIVHGRYL